MLLFLPTALARRTAATDDGRGVTQMTEHIAHERTLYQAAAAAAAVNGDNCG